jgi:hypothetical protein
MTFANRIAIATLTGLLLAGMVSCTRNLKEIRLVQPDAGRSLLIAGDASEFKDAIRMAIIDRYRASCTIDIINIDKLPKISGDNYNAVLIMDTCLAWSNFNPSVKSFLDNSQNDNVVFFMTADDPEWRFSYNGVDAITSASEKTNQDAMIRRLSAAIDEILGRF